MIKEKYKILYISPSTLFLNFANEIQVLNMCSAFNKLNYDVVLFANIKNKLINLKYISNHYGINTSKLKINSITLNIQKGVEFFIFIKSLLFYFKNYLNFKKKYKVYSRNIFSTFFFGVLLNLEIIYECHSIERGYRGYLQSKIIRKSNIKVICISNALKKIFLNQFKEKKKLSVNIFVCHDASNDDVNILTDNMKIIERTRKLSIHKSNFNKKFAGYFGGLYQGRGIHLLIEVAKLTKDVLFLIFGGDQDTISKLRNSKLPGNFILMGFVNPSESKFYMSMMDVLLMPYQKKVSIGVKDINTSKWMSPLKMFEYMSTGVPIIASDIKVLKEVLKHNKNSLLVDPENPKKWSDYVKRVIYDKKLSKNLSTNALINLRDNYTWTKRAKFILSLF